MEMIYLQHKSRITTDVLSIYWMPVVCYLFLGTITLSILLKYGSPGAAGRPLFSKNLEDKTCPGNNLKLVYTFTDTHATLRWNTDACNSLNERPTTPATNETIVSIQFVNGKKIKLSLCNKIKATLSWTFAWIPAISLEFNSLMYFIDPAACYYAKFRSLEVSTGYYTEKITTVCKLA